MGPHWGYNPVNNFLYYAYFSGNVNCVYRSKLVKNHDTYYAYGKATLRSK